MAQALLEPVAAGQTRFRMQGLAPDARGIAIGRECLLVFPTIDRLVAFLGAYSEEASIDDLVPTMTLEHARRGGGGHALLLRCAAGDGYALDRLSRLAGATRGRLYTGGGSTFVGWRERGAPFGYDLAESVTPEVDEVVVVDPQLASRYTPTDRMDPIDLIQRLELRPVPLPLGGIGRDPDLCGLREMALALVPPGLAKRALAHLWRLNASMAGYFVRLKGDERSSLLLRLRQPSPRVLDLLHGTPGIEVLAAVSPRAAVEVGYRHPIRLSSASSCFPGSEMFLFRGTTRRVERLPEPPQFVDGSHLVETGSSVDLRDVGLLEEAKLEPLRVEMRLRPSAVPREPRASLVPWEQTARLRRLVYLIPPSALSASRLIPLRDGIVVITGSSVGTRSAASLAGIGASVLLPLGRRLCEAAPGVLVPDGYELWPRIRPQLTRELLGLSQDDHALFLSPDAEPIRVAGEDLIPLEVAAIARLELARVELLEPDVAPIEAAEVENLRPGRFALWGFRGVESKRPTPPAPTEASDDETESDA